MKTIIAGSRRIGDYELLKRVIAESGFSISSVISGAAMGVDKLGAMWGLDNGLDVVVMPADWEKYGKSAGFKRNEEMAKVADALIAIWDGRSRGTEHMIFKARMAGLKVYVHNISE